MSPYKIAFAPLQGFTDAAYRNAHARIFGGVDSYYTPFVRIERNDFRTREMRDILPENNNVDQLIPQAIANKPEELGRIIERIVANGHSAVDINMGCPYPLLVRKHKGSGILAYPEEVEAMLSVLSAHPETRFSVKMRLGWASAEESMALLPLLNALPLTHITLHARLGNQQYKGETMIEEFARFYEACAHPLYYNGSLNTVEDIEQIVNQFPRLEGVMLGRGLLANPALAMEYKQGTAVDKATLYDQVSQLHAALVAHYTPLLQGDAQLLSHLKPHWEYLLPDAEKRLRKQIIKSNNMDRYLQAVDALLYNR